jgi:hypothetical protein
MPGVPRLQLSLAAFIHVPAYLLDFDGSKMQARYKEVFVVVRPRLVDGNLRE